MEQLVEEKSASVGEWLAPAAALERFEAPAGMQLAAAAPEKRARYGFRVGNLNFLIKSGATSEVVQRPAIWNIPGAEQWMLGLMNLRSTLVPVFDLGSLLSVPRDGRQAANVVLVFEQGEKAVGIVIDDFPRPLLDMEQLSSLPQMPPELQAHVRGGGMVNGAMWLEFDHESFFGELVRAAD